MKSLNEKTIILVGDATEIVDATIEIAPEVVKCHGEFDATYQVSQARQNDTIVLIDRNAITETQTLRIKDLVAQLESHTAIEFGSGKPKRGISRFFSRNGKAEHPPAEIRTPEQARGFLHDLIQEIQALSPA